MNDLVHANADGTPTTTTEIIAAGSKRNTPYQKYMHHFEVIPHEFEKKNGDIGCSYTTYVQPSGIDFIRKKLGFERIDPPLPGVVKREAGAA